MTMNDVYGESSAIMETIFDELTNNYELYVFLANHEEEDRSSDYLRKMIVIISILDKLGYQVEFDEFWQDCDNEICVTDRRTGCVCFRKVID